MIKPMSNRFQFTRPAWGATGGHRRGGVRLRVSIHAPRMGRDPPRARPWALYAVSIHAPRMGRDFQLNEVPAPNLCFNSRAPHGARLASARRRGRYRTGFNSRAPHGARLLSFHLSLLVSQVSIHAPRMGRDFPKNALVPEQNRFQFTRPAWGATSSGYILRARRRSFNSRAPHGARLLHVRGGNDRV